MLNEIIYEGKKYFKELTVSKIMRKSLGPTAWGRIIATTEKGRDSTR